MEYIDTISHVEFCPMFDSGHYSVHSYFEDAQYFAVYSAWFGEPAKRMHVFQDAEEAFSYMETNPAFGAAKLWYNGYEVMQEIRHADDILAILAEWGYDESKLLEVAEQLGLDAKDVRSVMRRLV